jgi:deoxycytidylate deaminase
VSNSILNKCTNDVAGARIYVMEYPDCESAKVIIQSRIEEVVVLGDAPKELELEKETEEVQAGHKLLEMAGVKVRYYKPNVASLSLDFVAKMSPTTTTSEDDSSSSVVEGFEQDRKKRKVAERCVAKETLFEEAHYDASKVDDNGKRKNFLSWQDYL